MLDTDTSDGRGYNGDYIGEVLVLLLLISTVAAFCSSYLSFKLTDWAIKAGIGEAFRLFST